MNETTSQRPTVIGIGEVLWDLLPTGKQLGGAPTNFAFHAQQLGAAGVVASAVGDDPLGREILQQLQSLGLGTHHVAIDRQRATGTVGVTVDSAGVPDYVIHRDVAWDFVPTTDLLLDAASRADAICFGTLAQRSPVTRQTVRAVLGRTRPECLRVFDINLRQRFFDRDVVADGLRVATVLKLNDQELPVVAELLDLPRTESGCAEALFSRFDTLRLVALTRGGAGSTLFGRDGQSSLPVVPTRVIDTVGAGDAFTAALVIGLLRGEALDMVHARASRVAGFVCTQRGATPVLPRELLA